MELDFRGYFFFTLYYKWLETKALFYTILIYVLNWSKGIFLSDKCKFYGYTMFMRHPHSLIQIKNGCRFRSSFDSNLIGISKKCCISTHSKGAVIKIGSNCGFSGTSIMALTSIIIGDDVLTGANTVITDCDWHNINPLERHSMVKSGKPVVIENNVFIGYGVTILKGVVIGENSVIGANSVVVSNIPPNSVAAGNPCRVISRLKINV